VKELLTLVGTRFLGIEAVQAVKAMKAGDVVCLIREPDNPHDGNAIKVMARDRTRASPVNMHVGYVKGTDAVTLAKRMDKNDWRTMWGNVTYAGATQPMIEIEGE
jgi:hypothetical protein